MITFYEYLKEVAVNSQDDPDGTNQAVLNIIANYGGGGLNYDGSNLPPKEKKYIKKNKKNNFKKY